MQMVFLILQCAESADFVSFYFMFDRRRFDSSRSTTTNLMSGRGALYDDIRLCGKPVIVWASIVMEISFEFVSKRSEMARNGAQKGKGMCKARKILLRFALPMAEWTKYPFNVLFNEALHQFTCTKFRMNLLHMNFVACTFEWVQIIRDVNGHHHH